ncbi:hypothetical protein AB0M28_33000, partial [Streptomyces sp. NPDC051940]|uniref:hypothetical protein n=1 Tax=Streptomyces sp. NPDC051940 TaxID=3155675 RepID=UPI003442BA9D
MGWAARRERRRWWRDVHERGDHVRRIVARARDGLLWDDPRFRTHEDVGWLVRRARRDPGALEVVWRIWLALDDGDDRLGDTLRRIGRPVPAEHEAAALAALGDPSALDPRLRGALLDCAARAHHPAGAAARRLIAESGDGPAVDALCEAALDVPHLAAFCRTHRLAPSGELRRAAFLVRTRQTALLREEDPDGTLLRAAYRQQGPQGRALLRDALTAAGELDLLRGLLTPDGAAPHLRGADGRAALAAAAWRLPLGPAVQAVAGGPPAERAGADSGLFYAAVAC